MKIYSVCVVKDEYDILRTVIGRASEWSDRVILIDNASVDGSDELARQLNDEFGNVTYLCQYAGRFFEGLRGLAYHAFGSELEPGRDWWCRLDSDEVYIDEPRSFLSKVPRYCRSVDSASFNFMFTDKDLTAYVRAPELYHDGACADSLNYYLCNHGETRFVRHGHFIWDLTRNYAGWPTVTHLYPKCRQRIRLRHLQYRYPEQIQKRIANRRAVYAHIDLFGHESDGHKRFTKLDAAPLPAATIDLIHQNQDVLPSQNDWIERVKLARQLSGEAEDGLELSGLRNVRSLPMQGAVVARDLLESKLPIRLPRRKLS